MKDSIKKLNDRKKKDAATKKKLNKHIASLTKHFEEAELCFQHEMAQLTKAKGILHSDEARDTMRKSFASQGYMLTQISDVQSALERVMADPKYEKYEKPDYSKKETTIKDDKKYEKGMVGGGKYAKVIVQIDKMLKTLEEDQAKDDKKKEKCEEQLREYQLKAVQAARKMDRYSRTAFVMAERIEQATEDIKTMTKEKQELKVAIEASKNATKAAKAAWEETDADDAQAAKLLGKAKKELEAEYKSGADGAVKKKAGTEKCGAGDEQNGIVAIVMMIIEDVERDRAVAKENFDDLETKAKEFEKASQDSIDDLDADIKKAKKVKADSKKDKGEAEENRGTEKTDNLDTNLKKYNKILPECTYYAVNYKIRYEKRKGEKADLIAAKGILSGSSEGK